MSPTGLFTPQLSEIVPNSIICGFSETLVLPLSKLVISLSNLPNMSINRNSFAPPKAHQANTVSHLWTDALKLKKFLVSSAISFSAPFWQRLLIRAVIIRLFIAQALQPAFRLLFCHYQGCLGNIACPVPKAELSEMRFDTRASKSFWRRKIVKSLLINVTGQTPVMQA
jgi:hypothetical protein